MSRADPPAAAPAPSREWTFLSNHAHVLICLAADPAQRLREVSARVGITERAVQKILADLEAEGLVEREREGRRNRYALHLDRPLRHPVESHRSVRELIDLVTKDAGTKDAATARGAKGPAAAAAAGSRLQAPATGRGRKGARRVPAGVARRRHPPS